ncbi:MAG TPA: alpha/beta hydrolase [Terrimicrobiaceae bacterium]|nr:alpha/beta hydrolase [Terrimicrobiaceae bacterium]
MSVIWLAIALFLFLWSLLAVAPAPTFWAFLLSVAAREYGIYPAVLSLVFLAVSWRDNVFAAGGFAAAAVLFLSAWPRAWMFARKHGLDFFAVPRGGGAVREERLVFEDSLHADCFWQPGGSCRPLVVVVHGGGWEGGNTRESLGFLRALARDGCFVASVSYRLAPQACWPAQRDDVLAGLRAVLARAEEWGIDRSRVYLLGASAGGQIASAVACSGLAPSLAGCMAFYAPFDMLFAYEHGREDDMLRSPQLLRQVFGGTPDAVPGNYRSASAYHLLSPASPPFLVLHGSRDDLVWAAQSRRFATRAHEVGVPCEYYELPWANHAFEHNSSGPGGRIAAAAVRKFLFGTAGR